MSRIILLISLALAISACGSLTAAQPQTLDKTQQANLEADEKQAAKSLEEAVAETKIAKTQSVGNVKDIATLPDVEFLEDQELKKAQDRQAEEAAAKESTTSTAGNANTSSSGKKSKPTSNKTANMRNNRSKPPKRDKTTSTKVNNGNSASRTLLAKSSQQLRAGQYRLAANNAERALRVSPRNPSAYYQLAVIHQAQRNYRQAIQFADKGLAQSGLSSTLRKRLWAVKYRCYSALGDSARAAKAKKNAG